VREEIERLQAGLKTARADVKWVRPTGVHLTIKFLGDVEENTIPALAAAASEAIAGNRALPLRIAGTGVFPSPSRPRVVWLGLGGDLAGLERLRRDVETVAAGFGFAPENRPFKPHLTLGRVRSERGRTELLAGLEKLDPGPVEFTAGEVILFKSDLRPSGAVYTALHRMTLGGMTKETDS